MHLPDSGIIRVKNYGDIRAPGQQDRTASRNGKPQRQLAHLKVVARINQPDSETDETDYFRLADQRPTGRSAVLSVIVIFQQLSDTRPTQPLRMEKCASNLVSAKLILLLLLDPRPLLRDNRSRRHAEQEESLASVKDDEVVGFCTIRSEERPGTIRIDRVAGVHARRRIGPVLDVTVVASGQASKADRPVSVKGLDADRGDRATHDIVHARSEDGIRPFEAGNATAAVVGMNVDDGPWNASKSHKEGETCHEKKILSELAHF